MKIFQQASVRAAASLSGDLTVLHAAVRDCATANLQQISCCEYVVNLLTTLNC